MCNLILILLLKIATLTNQVKCAKIFRYLNTAAVFAEDCRGTGMESSGTDLNWEVAGSPQTD